MLGRQLALRRCPRATRLVGQRRLQSTSPSAESLLRKSSRRAYVVAKWTGLLGASTVTGVFVVGSAVFLHDWFTYNDKHVERVPVSPLALHPDTGV